VVEMMRGDLGQPLGGWPAGLQKKILKGETPITVRPGSLMEDADLEAERAEAEKICGRPLSDKDLASYLMYPKVFTDFSRATRRYGHVSVLPTMTYFYGMKPGEELAIEIEQGKSLVVVLQAVGETDDSGQARVFFELNGQPRVITVLNRQATSSALTRRKADESDEGQIAAPMPGVVSSLVVKVGDKVRAGDVLLTMEAMKMEAALHAPNAGVVTEILVSTGNLVEAKDLLIVLTPQKS
jgi:pyruvate carboxylase